MSIRHGSLKSKLLLEEAIEIGEALLSDFQGWDEWCFRMVYSFTSFFCLFPFFWSAKVVEPPRKGFALGRSHFVDSASLVFQKDTIFRTLGVEKRILSIHESGVFSGKLLRRKSKMGSYTL
jgi:hypothetical protein